MNMIKTPILNKIPLMTLALFTLPVILLTYYLVDHPFKSELAHRSVSLSHYSREQRLNFITAARSLDGCVINPGQTFSFNNRVGARTGSRGFVPAPSYVSGKSVASAGGGICLISSCLYQTALLSGLKIKERAAHTTCVGSVPPGLDATVWYGQADLKLTNPYKQPVQIRCTTSSGPDNLVVAIYGTDQMHNEAQSRKLRRRELAFDGRNLLVEVYLDQSTKAGTFKAESFKAESFKAGSSKAGQSDLVSRDNYRLP